MAHLDNSQSGLLPTWSAPKKRERKPERAEVKFCESCDGEIQTKKRIPQMVDGQCLHCVKMFGSDEDVRLGGVTNGSPEEARAKIARIREAQWVMVLRKGSFGLPDGRTITIEPGDIFKCARAGREMDQELCTWERTKLMFSVEISIGGVPLVLWPHECAQINFVSIMQMKSAGELEECFLSSDDEQGHFKPNAQLREDIYATFGRLVNAPEADDPLAGRYG